MTTLTQGAKSTPDTLSRSSSQHKPAEDNVHHISDHKNESTVEKQTEEARPDDSTQRTIFGVKWFLLCASIFTTAFLYGLDTTIAADVQGPVVETFGHVDQLTWVGTGFPLGSVAVILILGSLYSSFNVKWVFIISIVIFEVGSAVCGAAPSMNALIVGRVIAGVGGSGIYMGALNYLTLLTAAQERGTYISGIGLTWGLGCILGPVIGGAFSSSAATWRWAFYINLPIAAVFAPVYFLYLPAITLQADVPVKIRLASIDFLGNLLYAATLVTLTVVLTFDGSVWQWNSGASIAVWVVFAVLLLATLIQQYFRILVPKAPFFPAYLLKNRSQILLSIAASAASTTLFVPVYFIPVYFQFTNGDTPIEAAVRLLPFVMVLIFVNMASGALLPIVGYYWIIYLVGGIFCTIGGALMLTVNTSTPVANIYGYTIILAFGSGSVLQSGYAVASVRRMLEGHAEDVPDVISLQNVSQLGAVMLCLLIAGQVFQSYAFNNLSAALSGLGFSEAELRSAVAGAQSTVFESLDPIVRSAAIDAITQALQRVWILTLVAGIVILVISLVLKKERLIGAQPVAGG